MDFFGVKEKKPFTPRELTEILRFLIEQLPGSARDAFSERLSGAAHFQVAAEAMHVLTNLYEVLEEEITKEQPRRYPSPGVLRKDIKNKFRIESYERTPFLLIFHAPEVQMFDLAKDLISRFFAALGWDATRFVSLLADVGKGTFLESVREKEGMMLFDAAEKQFLGSPRTEPLRELAEVIGQFVRRCHYELRLGFGPEKAKQAAEDIFRGIKQEWSRLGLLPKLAEMVPKEMLGEEYYAFLPKRELEEELRSKVHELEAVNILLVEETEKLRDTVQHLEKTKTQLQGAQQANEEFIRVVSHQFRTPLSAIRWGAEIALDFLVAQNIPKTEKLRDVIEAVRSRSIFLVSVLKNVFDLLAIESDTFLLNKKPAPLWELAEEGRKKFLREAERRGITLVFDKTAVPTEECLFDPERITQVIDTLLDNAIRYTAKEGTVTIGVDVLREEGKIWHHAFVKDPGIGIEPEKREKVFEKFFRSEEAVSAAPDGAGLGLFISRYILEAHGGKLWVESSGLGKGATFHLKIPKT